MHETLTFVERSQSRWRQLTEFDQAQKLIRRRINDGNRVGNLVTCVHPVARQAGGRRRDSGLLLALCFLLLGFLVGHEAIVTGGLYPGPVAAGGGVTVAFSRV